MEWRLLNVAVGFKEDEPTLFIEVVSPNPEQVINSSVWTWILSESDLVFVMMQEPLEIKDFETLIRLEEQGLVKTRSFSIRDEENRPLLIKWLTESAERGMFKVEVTSSYVAGNEVSVSKITGFLELNDRRRMQFVRIAEYIKAVGSPTSHVYP